METLINTPHFSFLPHLCKERRRLNCFKAQQAWRLQSCHSTHIYNGAQVTRYQEPRKCPLDWRAMHTTQWTFRGIFLYFKGNSYNYLQAHNCCYPKRIQQRSSSVTEGTVSETETITGCHQERKKTPVDKGLCAIRNEQIIQSWSWPSLFYLF